MQYARTAAPQNGSGGDSGAWPLAALTTARRVYCNALRNLTLPSTSIPFPATASAPTSVATDIAPGKYFSVIFTKSSLQWVHFFISLIYWFMMYLDLKIFFSCIACMYRKKKNLKFKL